MNWVWTGILICFLLGLVGLSLWMRFHWFIRKKGKRRDVPVTPRRFVYSLYSLLVFIFMVYGVALPYTIILFLTVWNREKRVALYHRFLCWSSRVIVQSIPGVDFTFNNTTGETFDKPGVIISNHQGHFDLMCIMMMTPKLVVLTNEWVWNNPLYGWIIKRAEFLPVSGAIDQNIEKLRNLIDRGYSIVVFPEGTRSADCRILRFHSGAFFLARELGVDLIPVLIHGVGDVIPKEDFMLRKGSMYIETLPRITVTDDGSPLYLRDLTRATRAMYISEFSRLKKQREHTGYFTEYVKYKYSYIKPGLKSEVSRMLERNGNFAATVDRDYAPDNTIVIDDRTYGVASWLMALVHPDNKVVGVIANKRHRGLARRTPAKPHNLLFVEPGDDYKPSIIING